MRATLHLILVSAMCALPALLAGCAAMDRPYPAKRCFALEPPQRPERGHSSVGAAVCVRRFRVSPPYHQPQFVYRLGDAEYKRDYYVEFIAPPAELMTGQAIAWLGESGAFRTTCAGSSAADNDLALEAEVTSLYGDYTNASSPEAVMAIHFFLLAEDGARTNVVFERAYSERVPLSGHEPDMLVRGWGQGFQRILTSLEADISALPPLSGALANRAPASVPEPRK